MPRRPFEPVQPVGDNATAYDMVQMQLRLKDKLDALDTSEVDILGDVENGEDALALTAGVENLIEHGLGESVRGWYVLGVDVPVMIWEVPSPSTTGYDETQHLVLACSVACNITLAVF